MARSDWHAEVFCATHGEEIRLAAVGAVIVAAGRSSRMSGVDKVFASLSGRPLFVYALLALQGCKQVDEVVLVTAGDQVEAARSLVEPFGISKLIAVCAGGGRRQDSVRAGLEQLRRVDVVVVHDAARPLVTAELIAAGLTAVAETGAAIAAIPVADTLKEADLDGTVLRTVPRERLWSVQTPQVFDFELLLTAHRQSPADATDDAMLVEGLGRRVKVFLGSPRNLKVTTPDDLLLVRAMLDAADSPQTM